MRAKFWAILYLICFMLLIVGIPLAIVGFKFEISLLIAISIALASIGFLGIIIAFLKMQYDLYCSGMIDLFIVWIKFWFTLFGGFGIWGVVTAIIVLKNR